MKLSFILCAVASIVGAANAVAVANAVPVAQPDVVDISDMKLRLRGSSPPPPSPAKREYETAPEVVDVSDMKLRLRGSSPRSRGIISHGLNY
ncbi:hypothetical protein N7470_004972 [Penicillium chermesinum]|nr:hypothetical protein N7470_004972 [Penicillium chermesinum]